MQGTGNDFVVLDETKTAFRLQAKHYRWLANRHFGIGADQILCIRPTRSGHTADFLYVIYNADGSEAEHCGNGARCLAHYIHSQGLSTKNPLQVLTKNQVLTLETLYQGWVRVAMGYPHFEHEYGYRIPDEDLPKLSAQDLKFVDKPLPYLLSIGNPHAIWLANNINQVPVEKLGIATQSNRQVFPQGVNVGFLQVIDQKHAKVRVYERGAGETLACGSGVCAAVVTGIRQGLLDKQVEVQTRGGLLKVSWDNRHNYIPGFKTMVYLEGPAVTVFETEIDIPEEPDMSFMEQL
jgi:diaminopimelate epimerase